MVAPNNSQTHKKGGVDADITSCFQTMNERRKKKEASKCCCKTTKVDNAAVQSLLHATLRLEALLVAHVHLWLLLGHAAWACEHELLHAHVGCW